MCLKNKKLFFHLNLASNFYQNVPFENVDGQKHFNLTVTEAVPMVLLPVW